MWPLERHLYVIVCLYTLSEYWELEGTVPYGFGFGMENIRVVGRGGVGGCGKVRVEVWGRGVGGSSQCISLTTMIAVF